MYAAWFSAPWLLLTFKYTHLIFFKSKNCWIHKVSHTKCYNSKRKNNNNKVEKSEETERQNTDGINEHHFTSFRSPKYYFSSKSSFSSQFLPFSLSLSLLIFNFHWSIPQKKKKSHQKIFKFSSFQVFFLLNS